MRWIAVLALGAGVGAVAWACGGDEPPSHAELVTDAGAVCRDAARRVRAIDPPDPADVAAPARVAQRVVAIQRRALASLRELEVPTEDRADVDRWLALVEATLDQAEASVRAQRDGDLALATKANDNGRLLDERADEIATRLGLAACVEAGEAETTTTS